jgi:hypothetical protein
MGRPENSGRLPSGSPPYGPIYGARASKVARLSERTERVGEDDLGDVGGCPLSMRANRPCRPGNGGQKTVPPPSRAESPRQFPEIQGSELGASAT